GAIEAAVAVQPRDAAARGAVDARERAANHNLVVALDANRVHGSVKAGAVGETRIDGSVRVQPHNELVGRVAVERREGAADQDFPVGRLYGDRVDLRVRSGAGVERRVAGAIRVHARDAIAHQPADREELAAGEDLAIALYRNGEHRVVHSGPGVER